MGTGLYRIGTAHRFYAPVHIASWGLRHDARQHRSRRKKCSSEGDEPPSAARNALNGHPNVSKTADHVSLHKIGCFLVITSDLVRCRGPPPVWFSQKSGKGGCPMGQHNNSQDVQNRFTSYLLVSLVRKNVTIKESRCA